MLFLWKGLTSVVLVLALIATFTTWPIKEAVAQELPGPEGAVAKLEADGNVFYYDDLSDAFSQTGYYDESTITLLADTADNISISNSECKITLDMNNHGITAEDITKPIFDVSTCELDIVDNSNEGDRTTRYYTYSKNKIMVEWPKLQI